MAARLLVPVDEEQRVGAAGREPPEPGVQRSVLAPAGALQKSRFVKDDPSTCRFSTPPAPLSDLPFPSVLHTLVYMGLPGGDEVVYRRESDVIPAARGEGGTARMGGSVEGVGRSGDGRRARSRYVVGIF